MTARGHYPQCCSHVDAVPVPELHYPLSPDCQPASVRHDSMSPATLADFAQALEAAARPSIEALQVERTGQPVQGQLI